MDAKRVVGLKSRLKLATAAPPQLVYHGGRIIQNVKVVTLYWGSAWTNDPLRTSIDQFFDFVVQSSLIDQLAEYNAGGQTIGRGSHTGSVLVTSDPGSTVDDTQIQTFLQEQINSSLLPQTDLNTVYFVFMPSGTTVTLQGSSSCQQFCGYHNVDSSGTIVYAVDTYDDCAGCGFGSDLLSSSTIVASHELCESITDPDLDAWFDDNTGEEIGDICEGSNKVINAASAKDSAAGTTYTVTGNATAMADGSISASLSLTPTVTPPPPPPPPPPTQSWTVQKEWSNAQGACV